RRTRPLPELDAETHDSCIEHAIVDPPASCFRGSDGFDLLPDGQLLLGPGCGIVDLAIERMAGVAKESFHVWLEDCEAQPRDGTFDCREAVGRRRACGECLVEAPPRGIVGDAAGRPPQICIGRALIAAVE